MMKKLLTAFVLSGLLATQAEAVQMSTGNPDNATADTVKTGNINIVTGDVEWTIKDYFDAEEGKWKTLYWTKITGNYNINLGEASLKATQNDAGEIAVFTTNADWTTSVGIGLTSNKNPYDVRTTTSTDPHVALYIAHPNYGQGAVEFRITKFNYKMDGGYTKEYTDAAGNVHTTLMPDTVYSQDAQNTRPSDSYNNQNDNVNLTFGYTLTAAHDEEGNITGMRFTMPKEFLTPDYTLNGDPTQTSVAEGTEGAERVLLETDVWLDSEGYYVDLPNMGYGFDLENLVSYGKDPFTPTAYALDDDAVTYILIKKDLREGAVIPEPTTATLSLLALAGLAARRRRK